MLEEFQIVGASEWDWSSCIQIYFAILPWETVVSFIWKKFSELGLNHSLYKNLYYPWIFI